LSLILSQAIVEIQQYAMNHTALNWVDPYTFNPDRWLEESDAKPGEGRGVLHAMQSFSVGPRNCIGRK